MRVPATTKLGVRWPRRITGDFLGLDPKCLALTIDDGPTSHTEEIVMALGTFGVRVTFFVIGELANRTPALVERMLDSGHAVGIHGWTHTRFPQLSDELLLEELRRTRRVVPTDVAMVRPPYGDLDERTLAILQSEGLEVVGWSVYAEDWSADRPRSVLAAEIANDMEAGDIVLLHDRAGAAEIVNALLPAAAARGLAWTQLKPER